MSVNVPPFTAVSDTPMLLAEATVYDKVAGATTNIYLADRSGYRSKSTDPGGANSYVGRIVNGGTITIDLISAWTKGLAVFGVGELDVANTDDALALWKNYVFDGWPITLYLGTLSASGNLTKTRLITATMEQPDIGMRTVKLVLRTPMYGLDRPILSATFAGTGGTAPPEGDATVQGKIKPRVYGDVKNVELIPVDAANLIYFAADRNAVVEPVRDSGLALPLTVGPGAHGEYTTLAALYAAAPGIGDYSFGFDSLNTGATYVKLGALPAGQVTADVSDLFYNNSLFNKVVTAVLEDALGGAGLFVNSDCFYPLSGAYPSATGPDGFWGWYVNDQSTYADVLSQLAASVAGWVFLIPGAVNNGTGDAWMVGNFPNDDTLNSAVVIIDQSQIIDMTRLGNPKTPGAGVPVQQVVYEYTKNNTIQTSGLAPTLDAFSRFRYGNQYLSKQHTDTTVLTKFPLAQSITVESGAMNEAVPALAQQVADRLFTALGLDADFYVIKCHLTRAQMIRVAAPQIAGYSWMPCICPSFGGAALGVRSKRFGFKSTGNGTKCGVMTATLDLGAKEVTYVVWTTYRDG